MRAGIYLTALGCVISASLLLATTPSTTTRQTTTTQPDLSTMVTNLASPNPAIRDAAQKQLDNLPWTSRDTLAALADKSPPDIKSRLITRVEALNLSLVTEPPPISLNIKDATFAETLAALSKATGSAIQPWPPSTGPMLSFTLAAHDKPFWDIFLDLSRQNGLSLNPWAESFGMSADPRSPVLKFCVLNGAAAFFLTEVSHYRTSTLQPKPDGKTASEDISFWYTAAVDPRVRIIKYRQPQLTVAIDDLGNTLKPIAGPNDPWISERSNLNICDAAVSLNATDKLGSKITSVKGLFRFVVELSRADLEIPDISKRLNLPISIADTRSTLVTFTTVPSFALTITTTGPANAFPPLRYALFDAAGAKIASYSIDAPSTFDLTPGTGQPFGRRRGGAAPVGPFRLTITAATGTREFSLPFEFKNIEIP